MKSFFGGKQKPFFKTGPRKFVRVNGAELLAADEIKVYTFKDLLRNSPNFIFYMLPDIYSAYVSGTFDSILIGRIGGALGPLNLYNLGSDILAPLWDPSMPVSQLFGEILELERTHGDRAEIIKKKREIARLLQCSMTLGLTSSTLFLAPWLLSSGPLLTATGYTDCINGNVTRTNTTAPCTTVAYASWSYTAAATPGAIAYVTWYQAYVTGSATSKGNYIALIKVANSALLISGYFMTRAGYIFGPGLGQSISYISGLLMNIAYFCRASYYRDYRFHDFTHPGTTFFKSLISNAIKLIKTNWAYALYSLAKYYSPLFITFLDVENAVALGFFSSVLEVHLYTLAGNGATASQIEQEIGGAMESFRNNLSLTKDEIERVLKIRLQQIVMFNTGLSVALTAIPTTVLAIPSTNQAIIRFYNIMGPEDLSESTMAMASQLLQYLAIIIIFLTIDEVFSNALRALDNGGLSWGAASLIVTLITSAINMGMTSLFHYVGEYLPYNTVLISILVSLSLSSAAKAVLCHKAINSVEITLDNDKSSSEDETISLLSGHKSDRGCWRALSKASQCVTSFFNRCRGSTLQYEEVTDEEYIFNIK